MNSIISNYLSSAENFLVESTTEYLRYQNSKSLKKEKHAVDCLTRQTGRVNKLVQHIKDIKLFTLKNYENAELRLVAA